ncbi:MAG: hypothetical protein V1894_05730 [Chloroflexota bacterium]
MKSSNRWLIGFVAAIGVIVLVAVILVLTARNNVSLLPEDTPEGVVQRFLLALQEKDYPKAYGYLSLTENYKKVSYEDWLKQVPPYYGTSSPTWKATLGKTTPTGDRATVEVFVDVFRQTGSIESSVQTQQVLFQLTRISGTWLITSSPGLYLFY